MWKLEEKEVGNEMGLGRFVGFTGGGKLAFWGVWLGGFGGATVNGCKREGIVREGTR